MNSEPNDCDDSDTAALGEFVGNIELSRLPSAIVEKARACLLYGLAVAIGCKRAQMPWIALRSLHATAPGEATCLLDGRRVPSAQAAFANAALFHARVQEDAHPAGHIGVVVLPAALAVAERVNATGADLLAAIVAGYEVALRIGRDHAADLSERGFRTTSAYGPLAAAAVTARLTSMTAQMTSHALALAANTACGLREFAIAGSEEYAFHAGIAARNGIEAAELAAAGARAAGSTLRGDAGFYRAFGYAEHEYGKELMENLGTVFEMREIAYKPYPVCQFHRGTIYGVLQLRAETRGSALAKLVIRMHPFEADFFGVRYAGPYTTFSQTFMSAPFCAALAWTCGEATYAGMHDFTNTEILRVVRNTQVIADLACVRYAPRITAILEDGRSLEFQESRGAGAFQLTWDVARHMMDVLCNEAGVGRPHATSLMNAIDDVAAAPSIAGVITAARTAIAAADGEER